MTRVGLIAAVLASLGQRAVAQEPYPGFEAYVTKALQGLKTPGAAVAIVRNDSVIYAKGFGLRAAGDPAVVDERTLFEIGSSTKAFTATLVAMLVSDGKMQFDDLVTKYLPDFKLFDPVASAQVTIRDALVHRSGIGRGEVVWLDAGTSREDVLHRVRFLKPESPFRSKWSYQNMMYLAAGEAAAKAAGGTWDDLVQQRIMTPLGMTSSSPTHRGIDARNLATPHIMESDSALRMPPFLAENIAPAGSIVSSVTDMAQWLRFQLNDGVVGGRRLLSTAALRETHSPQMVLGENDPTVGDASLFHTYGMGWFVQDYRHELMWQHGGNTPGMTAAVGMLPQKQFGVVILSNMDHTPLPAMLMRYLFDRHLGAPVKDYVGEALARIAGRRPPADTSAPHQPVAAPLPLTAYVGTFADSLYGEATVSIQNGRLELVRGLQHGPLEYWNATNFRWSSNGSIPALNRYIKFDVTADNKVTGLYFGYPPDIMLLGRKRTAAGNARRSPPNFLGATIREP